MDPQLNFPPSITIMVRGEEEDFPLQVPVSATIMQVKIQISQQLGRRIAMPANKLELSFENGLLRNEMTMQHYGISHGSVLTVVPKITVTIQIGSQHLSLFVSEDVTVATLKDYLVRGYGVDTNDKALQMMYEGNTVVLDDRSYLWAAGVENGTCLSLVSA